MNDRSKRTTPRETRPSVELANERSEKSCSCTALTDQEGEAGELAEKLREMAAGWTGRKDCEVQWRADLHRAADLISHEGQEQLLETFDTDRLALQFNRGGAHDRPEYERNMVKRIERAIEDASEDREHLEDTVRRLGLEVVLRSELPRDDGQEQLREAAEEFLVAVSHSPEGLDRRALAAKDKLSAALSSTTPVEGEGADRG